MTCDKWYATSDMWHGTHEKYSMLIIFSIFQVPSSYCFGMVEKWHVRGISIGNRQYFSIAFGKTWQKGSESVQQQKGLGKF